VAQCARDAAAVIRRLATFAVAGGVAAAATGAECGAELEARTRRVVHGDGVTIAFAPDPAPVRVGRHFALDVVVCPAPESAPAVDAEMPAHRHGMNYRAQVERVGPAAAGRFRARGMMFHMPGHWRVLFDVGSGKARQRLGADVDVP
jgi:hypothetical protein